MSEAASYLRSITADDTVLIVQHWDMDGSSSAAILSRIIETVRGEGADHVTIPADRRHKIGQRTKDKLEEHDVTKFIVVDMSVPADHSAEIVERYDVDMLHIDHHTFDREPEHAVFVNPRQEDDDAYVPAAKVCNDIADEFGLDTDWIAGLGVIQDFGVKQCPMLFERLQEAYPRYFPKTLNQDTLAKHCRYGRYSTIMNVKPYKQTDHCVRLAFDALTEAQTLKHLESTESFHELEKYHEAMEKECNKIQKQFEEQKEVYEDKKLVLFTFESDFHINSSIATQISLDKPEWAYIVMKKETGRVNVSSRCQSGRVDLGARLQAALPEDVGPDAEAGGHKKAAGASFGIDHLDAFKANLINQF
ncbi:MAG: DHHA1 domain-containing protein [Candidatus Nanohaloarchaeota archaeon QJJ-5]|nr:DHHA1 domain-containing protein [Candidatus Nanohaloarchaeota archaeon QJJ-5]